MDPFTIAAGLGAAGQLFGGITGLMGGNSQMAIAQANARQSLQESGVNAQEALMSGDRTAAHGAVQAAANGGGLTGSAMGVIQDLSNQSMFNARQAVYRGQTQANADIYQGEVAQTQGQRQLVSGVIGAGSSLVGGWARSSLMTQWNNARQGGLDQYGYGGGEYSSPFPFNFGSQ